DDRHLNERQQGKIQPSPDARLGYHHRYHGVIHTPFADGPTVRAVKIELVEAEFIRQYPTGLPDSKRRQFDRSIRAAQGSGQIASRADDRGQQWIWRS